METNDICSTSGYVIRKKREINYVIGNKRDMVKSNYVIRNWRAIFFEWVNYNGYEEETNRPRGEEFFWLLTDIGRYTLLEQSRVDVTLIIGTLLLRLMRILTLNPFSGLWNIFFFLFISCPCIKSYKSNFKFIKLKLFKVIEVFSLV